MRITKSANTKRKKHFICTDGVGVVKKTQKLLSMLCYWELRKYSHANHTNGENIFRLFLHHSLLVHIFKMSQFCMQFSFLNRKCHSLFCYKFWLAAISIVREQSVKVVKEIQTQVTRRNEIKMLLILFYSTLATNGKNSNPFFALLSFMLFLSCCALWLEFRTFRKVVTIKMRLYLHINVVEYNM